jgi:hypothetical protein
MWQLLPLLGCSVWLKADSHIPCRSPAVPMPFPCRSAKALDCVFPIWFTQCGRVWLTHTMPFPCHATNMPFWKRLPKARAGSRQGDDMRRHIGELPAFGLLLLPRGIPGSLLSEAYQSYMQLASVKQSNVCDGRGKAYYFGARTWVLVWFTAQRLW